MLPSNSFPHEQHCPPAYCAATDRHKAVTLFIISLLKLNSSHADPKIKRKAGKARSRRFIIILYNNIFISAVVVYIVLVFVLPMIGGFQKHLIIIASC